MTHRRDFLKSVIAAGIAVALPIPLAEATDQQIESAWQSLSQDTSSIVFAVDEHHTISCPWEEYPTYRHEIFDVNPLVRSRRALLREIENCGALASYYEVEFDDALASEISFAVRLDRQDRGWQGWVLSGSLKEHRERIQAWLDDSIGDEELPLTAGPVGAAYEYFQCKDYSTLDQLGVVIVEGEFPGSSYFAAELRVPIEQANASAERNGIAIRFVAEG